jgi:predicted amidohydrolase
MVRETVARAALAWRSRVRRLPPAATRAGDRVAAVQMRIRPYRSGEAFAAHVGDLCARAVAAGAGLIVFPEDAATGLLGMLPGFDRLERRGPAGVAVADVFAFAGPYVERVVHAVFSQLAARHRATIVAGTALLPRDGRVLNLCHVFGPDGRLLGVQPKLHLFPFEAEWGIAAGDGLQAWDTPYGRLCAPVCMDATYFETFRIARALGAEIAAVPSADPEPYNVWKKRRGPWARAQESGMFVVQACLFGRFAGLTISGRSACYAPLSLTPAGDGILAEVADPEAEGVAVARCDVTTLPPPPAVPDALRVALRAAYATVV